MFINIQTFFFDTGIDTQTMKFLDAIEQGKSAGCCPEVDHEDTKQLCTEEAPAEAVEGTICG